MSKGASTISNLSAGDDVQATRCILEQLGIKIESLGLGNIKIHGKNGCFLPPTGDLNCGNSGTTMRLLAGLLAGQSFSSRLIGDESLSQRPMERIITPLRQMGVALQAEANNHRPPLLVGGNQHLVPLDSYTLPIASAQLKSSLLLAALFAKGRSTITELTPTRDHTERLFKSFQISFDETKIGSSKKISVTGPQTPQACNMVIPGDISSAAFWIIAAAARPESHLTMTNVGLNPTRTGFLKVLERMTRGQSQNFHILKKHSPPETDPFGDIVVQGTLLTGTRIEGDEIPGLIDELPILAIAGALAQGTTCIRDARELRVKETDRIAALVHNLRAMGVVVKEYDDGLEIQGGSRLQGTSLKSFGDHRIAMAFSIAALFADGPSTIDHVHCMTTSYPSFIADFNKLCRSKTCDSQTQERT